MKLPKTYFKKFTGEIGSILAIRDGGHCWFVTRSGDMTKYIPGKHGKSIAVKVFSEKHLWRFLSKSKNPKIPAFERWLKAEVIPEL